MNDKEKKKKLESAVHFTMKEALKATTQFHNDPSNKKNMETLLVELNFLNKFWEKYPELTAEYTRTF